MHPGERRDWRDRGRARGVRGSPRGVRESPRESSRGRGPERRGRTGVCIAATADVAADNGAEPLQGRSACSYAGARSSPPPA